MTREKKEQLIRHLKYNLEIGADYLITDEDVVEIIKALEQEPTTKNDLGVDCISRADAIKAMQNKAKKLKNEDTINGLCGAVAILYEMPPVTPQPKTGYWIKTPKAVMGEGYMWYCDKCEHQVYQDSSRPYPSEKYCPNCGARMIEPQERSK